jgi:hypothetical protein
MDASKGSFAMLNALIAASLAIGLQSAKSDEIIVTGQKPLERAEAQKAVDAVTVSHHSQIARFLDPVCPSVIGLPTAARQVVEGEIRSVAAQVGARVADAACEANLIVILAADGKKMFSDVRKKRPEWLEGLSHRDVQKILNQQGPVRAWSVRILRNEDGRTVKIPSNSTERGEMQIRSASILKQTTSLGIGGSVMIIDDAAVEGRSLGEVGQYAAMRGLALTRVPESESFGTILRMFSSASAPRALTQFDRDYLTALYAGDGRQLAVQEKSRIAKAIAATAGS